MEQDTNMVSYPYGASIKANEEKGVKNFQLTITWSVCLKTKLLATGNIKTALFTNISDHSKVTERHLIP